MTPFTDLQHDAYLESIIETLGKNFFAYRHNSDGQIEYLTKNFESIIGITLEDAIGHNYQTLVHWEQKSLNNVLATLEEMLETENYYDSGILHFTHPVSNDYKTIKVSIHVIQSSDSGHFAIEGIVEDISELQKVQNQVSSERNKFKTILSNAADAIHIVSMEGKLVECSDTFCDMLGYSKEEVLSLHVPDWDLTAASNAEHVDETAMMKERRFQSQFIRKDKSILDVEVIIKVIELEGENYFLVSARDLSEVIKQNIALAYKNEQIALTLSGANAVAWEANLIEGTISLPYRDFFGYEEHEVNSFEKWFSYVHPDDIADAKRSIDSLIEGQSDATIRLRYLHKTGEYRWLEGRTKAGATDANGTLTHFFGITYDVHESHQLKQAIIKEKETLQSIIYNSNDGIHILDMEGNIVMCSLSFAEMLGYTHEEALKLHILEWEKSITPDEIQHNFELLLQGPQTFPSTHTTKTGTTIEVEIACKRMIIGDEAFLFASSRDVTEQKRLQKELIELNTQFQSVAENVPGLIYGFKMTPEGEVDFPYLSSKSINIFGFDAQALHERPSDVFSNVHPDDMEALMQSIMDSYSSLTIWEHSFRVNHPLNGLTWVHGVSIPHKQADNSVIWYGYASDITEKILHDESIKEYAQKLELATKSANQGVWLWDFQTNMVDWDENMFAIFGLENTHQPIAFEVFSERLHDDAGELQATVEQTINEAKPLDTMFKIMRPDGAIRFIQANGLVNYDVNNIPVSMVGINSDVTGFEEAKAELIQAKINAENANQFKSEFLANMSHEIRTPITAILGFVEQLVKNESDPQRLNQFNIIYNSGNSLLGIINDILDFSKIESGKIDIELQPFDIHDLLEKSAEMFTQLAMKKSIAIKTNIDASLPQFLTGDSVRIRQVLFNLLSNAIKFSQEHSTVMMDIRFNTAQEQVSFSVTDTGIGIAQENLDKIFDAFTQEDSSTTRRFGGTGLGLSISSKLVDKMGGKLSVESIPGERTTFTFTLKLSTPDHPMVSQQDQEVHPVDLTSQHILVVEDNKTNQILMRIILDELHQTYEMANDGIEAVEKFQTNRYDIILMDENMPNLNGIEATAQIRAYEKSHGLNETPIIAVTANAMKGDRERFIAAGMNDYLSKPYTEQDIADVLKKFSTKKAT